MSSYGIRVWTPTRQATAEKLVTLANTFDDDTFAQTLHAAVGIQGGWPFPREGRMRLSVNASHTINELLALVALIAEAWPDA